MEGDEGVTYDGNLAVQRDLKVTQISIPKKHGLRKLLAYVGHGFLVAIAYIDPGNFESDLQACTLYKYELLWVLLLATIAGALIQSLTSNLGFITVIGIVYALNMLFRLPLWLGVILTGFNTLIFLALQQYGCLGFGAGAEVGIIYLIFGPYNSNIFHCRDKICKTPKY